MGGNQPGTRSKAGGLVVQAGAGTGKTQFLVERYLDLLKEVSPLEIVAVTFTEKAALELRGRIRQGIQKAQVGWAPEHRERLLAQLAAAPIGTLHSLAARICREFPLEAGVPPDFQVLDEVEALLWLRDWLEEALLEALEGGTFDPLLEVLGYEGLRATLRHVVEDPLEASRLLEMGPLRMWENLRARIWDIVYRKLQDYWKDWSQEDWNGLEDFLEAWRKASPEDPRSAQRLLDLAGENRVPRGRRDKLWRPLELLREVMEVLKVPGDALNGLAEVWPSLSQLALKVLAKVEEARFKSGRLAFAHLEEHALRALEDEKVRAHYQNRFRYLLVDEFQDTNPVQMELLRGLFPDPFSWTVVGDVQQSIYSFRRADPRVMKDLVAEVEKKDRARIYRLDTSQRHHQGLVDFYNSLFPRLLPDYEPVRAACPQGESPAVVAVVGGSLEEQARWIAEEVKALLAHGLGGSPLAYRDVAVLGWRWQHLGRVAEVLEAKGVPALEVRGGNLLETREFQDAYLALRFLANPRDEEALLGILRSPFFGLTDGELWQLAKGRGPGEVLWDALSKQGGRFAWAKEVLDRLLARRGYEAPSRLLLRLDLETGYSGVVAKLPRGARRVKDLEGSLDLVRKLEVGAEDPFLVVRQLKRFLQEGVHVERPPLASEDAVSLSTIHSAKGLEWPVVFVVEAQGVPPNKVRSDRPLYRAGLALVPPIRGGASPLFKGAKWLLQEEEAQEKRRVFYVACTRASKRLYLLFSSGKGGVVDIEMVKEAGAVTDWQRKDMASPPPDPAPPVGEVLGDLTAFPLIRLPISLLSVAARDLEAARRYLRGEPVEEVWEAEEPAEDPEEEALATIPSGRNLGQMVHFLLERLGSLAEVEEKGLKLLQKHYPAREEKEREEAVQLARNFYAAPVFQPYWRAEAKEVPVVWKVQGVYLEGRADRVGADWVMDYKTDLEVDLSAYKLQVGAYALALGKRRALVADLREKKVHEIPMEGLKEEIEALVQALKGQAES